MSFFGKLLPFIRHRNETEALSVQLKEARAKHQSASDEVKKSALLTRDSSEAIKETIRATLERMDEKYEPHRSHLA